MKKISKILIVFALLIITISTTVAYFNSKTKIINDIFTKKYYLIINTNGGNFADEYIVVENNQTTLPTPTKKGYEFLGLSEIPNGTIKYSTNINNVLDINNIELFARWNILEYTISYVLNGGYLFEAPLTYNVEDEVLIPNPTKEGYTFTGWIGTGLDTPTKDLVLTHEAEDKNYEANWNTTTYNISYNLDGGNISGQPTSYTIEDVISVPNPTKEGYDFAGWTGTGLDTPTKDLTFSNEIDDRHYTANWELSTYNISYNLDGGNISGQPTSYTIEDNVSVPNPTKNGYTFTGWTGTGLSTPTKDLTFSNQIGNKSYTANWEAITYTISYNLNGGNISGQPTSYTIENNVSVPNPTKNGYTFKGWTGTGLSSPTKNLTFNNQTGNKSYTANWEATTYTISYNLNGGNINGQPTSYTIENNVSVPNPTKNGYSFTGWTGTGLSSPTKNLTFNNQTGNKSYTANWEAITYTISYNLNGGSISGQPTSYNINSNITLPKPTKTGYDFAGWIGTGLSGATQNVSFNNSTGDRSYTATWTPNVYYAVDINPIIQNVYYNGGLDGFTFSVWIDGTLVADHVIDYYNNSLSYGQTIRVYVYDRDGYSVNSFRDNTWTITSSFDINPSWYDNIPPTIVAFQVDNLGYYNPSLGARGGFNVYIYIDAYDNGTGINKFQTWLVPYLNGSGSGRKDGQERIIKQVLYIEEPEGRTFCAYAIDNAGNESERCATLHITE